MKRAAVVAELGRIEEAVEAAERGRQLDPLSPRANLATGRLHYYAGNPERAIELMTRALDLGADGTLSAYLALSYGAVEQEAKPMEISLRFVPDAIRPAIQEAYAAGGTRRAVRAGLVAFAEVTGGPCRPFPETAVVWLAYLGETDRMFDCLDEAREESKLFYVKVDPVFAPYRDDPRFQAILEEMGLAD